MGRPGIMPEEKTYFPIHVAHNQARDDSEHAQSLLALEGLKRRVADPDGVELVLRISQDGARRIHALIEEFRSRVEAFAAEAADNPGSFRLGIRFHPVSGLETHPTPPASTIPQSPPTFQWPGLKPVQASAW